MERLTEQEKLAFIVLDNKKSEVERQNAVKNLTDQKALAYIVEKVDDYEIYRHAVEKCTDQKALAIFAQSNKNHYIRKKAIEKLTDPNVLNAIINDSEEKNVNKHTTCYIDDKGVEYGHQLHVSDLRETARERLEEL